MASGTVSPTTTMHEEDHGYIIFANSSAGSVLGDDDSAVSSLTCSTIEKMTYNANAKKRSRVDRTVMQAVLVAQDAFMNAAYGDLVAVNVHTGASHEVPNTRTAPVETIPLDQPSDPWPCNVTSLSVPAPIPVPIPFLPIAYNPQCSIPGPMPKKRQRGANYCKTEINHLLDAIEKTNPKDLEEWHVIQKMHCAIYPSKDRPATSLRKKFLQICKDGRPVSSNNKTIGTKEITRARAIQNSIKRVKDEVGFHEYLHEYANGPYNGQSHIQVYAKHEPLPIHHVLTCEHLAAFTKLNSNIKTTPNATTTVPNPLAHEIPAVIQIPHSPLGLASQVDEDNVSELGLDDHNYPRSSRPKKPRSLSKAENIIHHNSNDALDVTPLALAPPPSSVVSASAPPSPVVFLVTTTST